MLQYKLWFAEGSIPQVVALHRQLVTQLSKNDGLNQRNLALAAQVKNLKKEIPRFSRNDNLNQPPAKGGNKAISVAVISVSLVTNT